MTFSKSWTQSFKGTDSNPFRAHAIASRKDGILHERELQKHMMPGIRTAGVL